MKATMRWIQGMRFECHNRGVQSAIDASPEHGGEGSAPSPKELLLNAMMGCTGMDVMAILKKMRQEVRAFRLEIHAQKNQEHPIHFKTALLSFEIEGEVTPEKAIKAVEASLTKYCGVNYVVSKTCRISYQILVNGTHVHGGEAAFVDPVS